MNYNVFFWSSNEQKAVGGRESLTSADVAALPVTGDIIHLTGHYAGKVDFIVAGRHFHTDLECNTTIRIDLEWL